jgi:hypothetical protein
MMKRILTRLRALFARKPRALTGVVRPPAQKRVLKYRVRKGHGK